MKTLAMMTAVAGLALAGSAMAADFASGALTPNSPTFDNPGGSSSGSGIHFYDVLAVAVDTTGAYTFEAASPNTTGNPSNALDTFLLLYSGSFNPAAPAGSIASNDDFTGLLTVLPGPYAGTITANSTGFSGAQPGSRLLNVNLTAGTDYFLVVSSFRQTNYVNTTDGASTGPWYVGASGVGNITIPAPGALALLGLGGLAAARRRRA